MELVLYRSSAAVCHCAAIILAYQTYTNTVTAVNSRQFTSQLSEDDRWQIYWVLSLGFWSDRVDFVRVSDCFQWLKETRSARVVALHAFYPGQNIQFPNILCMQHFYNVNKNEVNSQTLRNAYVAI